jgi:hypothetical protein
LVRRRSSAAWSETLERRVGPGRWSRNDADIERWLATLADVRASRSDDTTTLPVALRGLRELVS